ncbi:TetR/AcrR family transcriptional regulator [Corynebacterium sputi]|uniref:TetR/AcrR family transcriptional regulator n=1 Tax=Corynebacterium sputi TaxID=489915 RepID=UPI00041E89F4|nr:TetR/AcrR family transcriptional regulator [Corynebacterium sputi]
MAKGSFIEDTRKLQIADATAGLIAEHGLAGATFTRIADAAGISPGLINYHFNTKANLLEFVLRRVDERMDQAMQGSREPEGHVDALGIMIEGFVNVCVSHPELLAARAQLETTKTGGIAALSSELDAAGLTELETFLAEGQRDGEFGNFDPAMFADLVMAFITTIPSMLARHGSDAAGREKVRLQVTGALSAAATSQDYPAQPG